jgi:hypothetical protein
LGVPESQALAYAILVHAALYFPITILGIFAWFRQQLSMKDLQVAKQERDGIVQTGARS